MRPVATYRLQLRGDVTFERAAALLPGIRALGASHLYLSPILQAVPGSTHGYDVTDWTRVDEALGGREGFERLARAARDEGLSVLLDIVPNHAAFHLSNPFLRDVLRHGERSAWARHFDIDWGRGRLVLPLLPEPFEAMAEARSLRAEDGADGPVLAAGDHRVPLTPHPITEAERAGEPGAIRALHDAQAWRLAHWELERDGVTHRRFFNVTGLIGLRVEEEAVFGDTHALVLELVREGLVQGLRVDHVDGLAAPGAYLERLREAAGVPVWIEKILMADEGLRPWPVEGTTGYEGGAAIARVLTHGAGLGRLDALWRRATGEERAWAEVLREAKGEVIRRDLAAELTQLRRLLAAAAEASGAVEAGEEAQREAVLALVTEMPRYRTYLEEGDEQDRRLLGEAADRAAAGLPSDHVLRFLEASLRDAPTPEAERLRLRFQQVTGALMAKAQEDTAFFRFTRCLAHCEVGAEPGEPHWSPARFGEWVAERSGRDLVLTSSHDTKRAEDARARLLAMTHRPDAWERVWRAASSLPEAGAVAPGTRWYVAQSLLALWEAGREDLEERLAAHVEKALREAREVTTWAHPRPEAEAQAEAYARGLARAWGEGLPPGAAELIALGEEIALAQVALKCALPGIPDLYQGAEGPLHHLTDPDNRSPVPWDDLRAPAASEAGFGARKARLTRELLRLRREAPGVFAAPARVEAAEGGWALVREGAEGILRVALGPGGAEALWAEGLSWEPAREPRRAARH